MKTILNYSHPLSPEARSQIHDEIGNFEEMIVKSQFDLSQPLKPQVDELIRKTKTAFKGHVTNAYLPHYIIPPALSTAAFWIGAHFPLTPIIWLKRTDTIPPTFILGGIE